MELKRAAGVACMAILALVCTGCGSDRFSVREATILDELMPIPARVTANLEDSVSTDQLKNVKVVRGALKGVEGEIVETPDGAFLAVRVSTLLCAKVRIPRGDAVPLA